MKVLAYVKFFIFILSGLAILIFHEACLPYTSRIVGLVMIAFATEDIVKSVREGIIKARTSLFEALVVLVLAALMIFAVHDNMETYLVIWGTWSILREGEEITLCIHRISRKKLAYLSLAESLFVIVLSLLLIIHPDEEHVILHLYILGVELILEVFFPIFYTLLDRWIEKRKAKKESVVHKEDP
ncbi:MAG: hypothetical protein IJR83_00080 [Clostridia bacterium]|nr:hypothetical protein [Clostridia bacterium]